jgi:hypothetical protein
VATDENVIPTAQHTRCTQNLTAYTRAIGALQILDVDLVSHNGDSGMSTRNKIVVNHQATGRVTADLNAIAHNHLASQKAPVPKKEGL